MLRYEDGLTEAIVVAGAKALDRPISVFLEDLGAFLATIEALRRLLQFGGPGFSDFLMSLDEIQSRGQLALPDLELPEIVLEDQCGGSYEFSIRAAHAGWSAVMAGLVRAMADDYGALVLIESQRPKPVSPDQSEWVEYVSVELLDASYVEGRSFALTHPEAVL